MAETIAGGFYLESLLAPLARWMTRPDVTDIYINHEQEVRIETLGGGHEVHHCAQLTEMNLGRLARQIAAYSSQGINREHPLLAASLPDGSRVQIVAPPATRSGYALAIRRHIAPRVSMADYVADGAFDDASVAATELSDDRRLTAVSPGDIATALGEAVRGRKNLLISGGTSTGKTTFLNAMLREVPASERLIIIEDTPEIELTHANSVGMLAARSALREADLRAEDLLMAALRMRPDRIILGELRGPEAFTFLRAVNSGHPGSMTTIHADSPQRAIEQLVLLVLQGGTRLAAEDVRHYVRASIDVFVQLERQGGRRKVTHVLVRN